MKEAVGGLFILEADDIDAAIEVDSPLTRCGRLMVEAVTIRMIVGLKAFFVACQGRQAGYGCPNEPNEAAS